MIENTRHWFFQDAELSEKPFKTRTFKEILRVIRFYVIMGFIGGFIILIVSSIRKNTYRHHRIKNRIKHFKPTIHEGVFSNTISWEERDTPLTDEELKNRY
jgi:hypothetical protein